MTTPQNPTPEQPDYLPPPDGYQPPATPAAQGYPMPAGGTPQPTYPSAGVPQGYPSAEQPQPYPGGQPGSNPQAGYQTGSYPQAGYQPAAPGAYQAAPGAFQPTVPAPTGSNRKGLAIGLVLRIGIPVALVLFGVIWALFQFHVEDAKVGDCLVQDGADSVKAVKCDDASAKYQVVAIFENQTEPTDLTNPCNDVAAAEASYWEGTQGGTGRVLCLKKL